MLAGIVDRKLDSTASHPSSSSHSLPRRVVCHHGHPAAPTIMGGLVLRLLCAASFTRRLWGCKVSTHLALPEFRGEALLLRVLHVVACDNVRDCVFLKDDLNSVKKEFNSYELNFSLPTNSQNKLTELN